MRERMQQDAVIRKLEVIGEAVKQLAPATKATHVDIQGREIAAMRDKMIHEYFGVNLEIVWAAVEQNLLELNEWQKRSWPPFSSCQLPKMIGAAPVLSR